MEKYCLLCKRWVEPEAKWGFGAVLIALILLGLGIIGILSWGMILIFLGIIYIEWKQTWDKRCPIYNSKKWGDKTVSIKQLVSKQSA